MTTKRNVTDYGKPFDDGDPRVERVGGPGTESNRARAARGGWGLGPLLVAAPKAAPVPVVFDDTPRPCTFRCRWDGHDYEVPYDPNDTSAQVTAKVAAAMGGKVSAGSVALPVPRARGSAMAGPATDRLAEIHAALAPGDGRPRTGFTFTMPSEPGTVIARLDTTGPEPVGSVSRDGGQTWEDAERWPVGATTAHTATGGPVTLGAADGSGPRPLPTTLAEAERLYGKGSPVWEAVRARVLAGVAPPPAGPQPDPAPGQVWLPPVGLGWADADGTLTLDAILPGIGAGEPYLRWRNGAGCCSTVLAREGWTCLGVATPHGRVMVGDGWAFLGGPEQVVTSVDAGGPRFANGAPAEPLEGSGWTRTRYAPARAGERYRSRQSGVTIACVKPGTQLAAGEHAVIEGAWADPAQWERLDAGTAPSLRDACRDGARELREVADNLRRIGVEAPPTLDDIHAAFCAASLGPVETLAIPSRGEVTVYLPAPRDGTFERASDLDRRFRSLLPASTCFTVRWRESVDVMALRGVAHRLIRGVSAQSAADDVEERVRAVADYTAKSGNITYRFKVVSAGATEVSAALQRIEGAAHAAATVLLRREIDALIAADVGQPFAHARAAALRSWGEQHRPTGLPPQRPAERMAALVAYEAQRGGARTPTAAAGEFAEQEIGSRTIGVYERERGRSDVQARRVG